MSHLVSELGFNPASSTSVFLTSKFQDNYMGGRPEYQRLMARTRRFLPLPLAPDRIAANEARIAAAVKTVADQPVAAGSPDHQPTGVA